MGSNRLRPFVAVLAATPIISNVAPPLPVTGSLPPPVLVTGGAVLALEPPRLESDPQCKNAPLVIASKSPHKTVAFHGAI